MSGNKGVEGDSGVNNVKDVSMLVFNFSINTSVSTMSKSPVSRTNGKEESLGCAGFKQITPH